MTFTAHGDFCDYCPSFVFLSVCEEDYCKSNQRISFKLGFMTRPTSWKNWLTFAGDPVLDTDSGSLFHFLYHCGIGDFRTFISISHTVIGWFSRHSCEMTDVGKVMNPQHFGSDPADIWIQIRIDPEIRIRIPYRFWLRLDALAELYAFWAQSSICICLFLWFSFFVCTSCTIE